MKLTRHNGRSGRNGTYNPKHNDRRFDVEHSEHIDAGRTSKNIYWDCYQGYHYPETPDQESSIAHSFEEIESLYYWEHYEDFCNAQNERNRKTGHSERNRSPDDLRLDKKTCPEESLIQIGTIEGAVSGETLRQIAIDFFEEFEERFGKHVHILDWSLHLDEATPHIHERHVFDCPNRYGEIAPQQEKALEALGIELPHPDQKPGRTNNRKMTFDAICRTMLFDIVKGYGLHLDEEPDYGGRKYLEKQDYIVMKKRKKLKEVSGQLEELETEKKNSEVSLDNKRAWIAEYDRILREKERQIEAKEAQLSELQETVHQSERKLETLTSKLADTETFIQVISDTAYEKAVETVTEKVAEETHNMDFEVIERFREKVKTNLPFEVKFRRVVYDITAMLMEDFRGMTKKITDKLHSLFSDEGFRAHMTDPIRSEVRERLLFGPPMDDDIDEAEPEKEPATVRRHRSR